MSAKKKGLGRGLNALLSSLETTAEVAVLESADPSVTSSEEIETNIKSNSAPKDSNLKFLPIDLIHRSPYQPRQEFDQDALEELAESIRRQGIIQPIVVRYSKEKTGHYEIVAGERRWRAAQLAQLEKIPALIRDLNNADVAAIALIENMQRENLNPIEEAYALQRLLEEFDFTHEQVAQAVGKSRTTVTNLLRLMNLDKQVQKMLERRDIEMGHARALLSLDPKQQLQVARMISTKNFSVRDTEKLVKKILNENASNNSSLVKQTIKLDPNIESLERELSEKLATQVVIHQGRKGTGKLIINYHDLEQLQGVLNLLMLKEELN